MIRSRPFCNAAGTAHCSSSGLTLAEPAGLNVMVPKDLSNAIKHLDDQDLDRLLAVAVADARLSLRRQERQVNRA